MQAHELPPPAQMVLLLGGFRISQALYAAAALRPRQAGHARSRKVVATRRNQRMSLTPRLAPRYGPPCSTYSEPRFCLVNVHSPGSVSSKSDWLRAVSR